MSINRSGKDQVLVRGLDIELVPVEAGGQPLSASPALFTGSVGCESRSLIGAGVGEPPADTEQIPSVRKELKPLTAQEK